MTAYYVLHVALGTGDIGKWDKQGPVFLKFTFYWEDTDNIQINKKSSDSDLCYDQNKQGDEMGWRGEGR